MSQGPQVLDMEYREPDQLEHGPRGPIFSSFSASTLSTIAASITLAWSCSKRWILLHEVMSLVIMVCVTLILKTFKCVHLVLFVSNACLDIILIHLTMSGGMTGCPSKLVPIGFELPLGGFMKSHRLLPSYLPFFTLHWSGHWVGQLFKGCPLPCGKKGLKARRVKATSKR
jgi:hypothetical protein